MRVREGYHSEQIRNRNFEEVYDRLGSLQKVVYDTLKKQAATCEEVAATVNRPMHVISARIHELRKIGIVVFAGESKSRSGKRVSLWKINPQEPYTPDLFGGH